MNGTDKLYESLRKMTYFLSRDKILSIEQLTEKGKYKSLEISADKNVFIICLKKSQKKIIPVLLRSFYWSV